MTKKLQRTFKYPKGTKCEQDTKPLVRCSLIHLRGGYSHTVCILAMCPWKGYGFQAIYQGQVIIENWSRIESHLKGSLHVSGQKLYKQKIERVLWYSVTKFANFTLVKGRTFANPAAHPHPNYMGVPPGLIHQNNASITNI